MKAKKPKKSQITKLNESLFVILTIVAIISTVFLFKGINNTNHMITGSISCTLCTNNTQPYPCNGSFENKNFTEGINETFTLCAKDDENDSIFFKLAQNSETWEDFTLYSNGTINVTPKKKDVGNHTLYILPLDECTDSCSSSATSYKVLYIVKNIDSAPEIIDYSPTNNTQTKENQTEIITANATDPDYVINPIYYNESLSMTWFVDGTPKITYYNTNISSFNYTPGWYDNGDHTIKLVVKDQSNKTANISLNIIVKNNDRPPYQTQTFPNITWSENSNSSVINLSDYFKDPDLDNNLSYSVNITNITYHITTVAYNTTDPENSSINFTRTNSSIKFIPSLDYYGVQKVAISYSDNYITKTSNAFYINVTKADHPPRIKQLTEQYAIINNTYYKQIEVNYIDHQNYTCSPYNDPSWLNLSSNCTINFYPTDSEQGSYNITVIATSLGGLKSNMSFNLTVVPDHKPTISPIPDQKTGDGEPFILYINASDPDINTLNDSLSFTTTTDLFTIQKINETTGKIDFTPTKADIGFYTITIVATDKWGLKDGTTFHLNITEVNHPPVLEEIPPQYPIINHTYNYSVKATDPDGDTLSYSSNDSLININAITGLIEFTPNESEKGIHHVNITVNDSKLIVWQTVRFNITTNHKPKLANLENKTIKQYSLFTEKIEATDPENQTLSYSASPQFIKIDKDTGIINQTFSTQGIYNISVTVKDPFNASDFGWFILTVNKTEIAPNITNKKQLSNITLHENLTTQIPIIVSYPGTDELTYHINITNVTNTSSPSEANFANITKYNNTYAIIKFNPKIGDFGNYTANIWVSVGSVFDATNSTITTMHPNHNPIINSALPKGLTQVDNMASLIETENSTLNFSANITDPDNDPIIYNWSIKKGINGTYKQISNQSNFSYHFGWYDSKYGIIFIKLSASDIWGAPAETATNAINLWTINVENLDRAPQFGLRTIPTDLMGFSNGTLINTADDAVTLKKDANGTYVDEGTYITPIFFIDDAIGTDYTGVEVDQNIPNQTSIKTYFRYATNNPATTDNIEWSTWTPTYELNASNTSNQSNSTNLLSSPNYCNLTCIDCPYNNEQTRYWQVKAVLSTQNKSKTPTIKRISIKYKIKDLAMASTITNMSWIYLPTFFQDPDLDDTLTYSWNISKGLVQLEYIPSYSNSSKGRLFIGTTSKISGNDTVTITATDKYGEKINSNPIKIILQETKTPQGMRIVYQTKTITKTQIQTKIQEKIKIKKVPEYHSFNLIVPKIMKMYPNDTIIAPITLDNYGNKSLINITLSANSSNKDLKITIPQKFIKGIPPKTKINTTMVISAGQVYGDYDVTVKAQVGEPKFNDTAVMTLTGLIKGNESKNQINTKIAFTKDLITSNSECREFSEMVQEAHNYIKSGDYKKANTLLNTALEGCKYMMTLKKLNETSPKKTEKLSIEIPQKNVVFGLISIIIISLILMVALIIYSRKMDKEDMKKEQEKSKKEQKQKQ